MPKLCHASVKGEWKQDWEVEILGNGGEDGRVLHGGEDTWEAHLASV